MCEEAAARKFSVRAPQSPLTQAPFCIFLFSTHQPTHPPSVTTMYIIHRHELPAHQHPCHCPP